MATGRWARRSSRTPTAPRHLGLVVVGGLKGVGWLCQEVFFVGLLQILEGLHSLRMGVSSLQSWAEAFLVNNAKHDQSFEFEFRQGRAANMQKHPFSHSKSAPTDPKGILNVETTFRLSWST